MITVVLLGNACISLYQVRMPSLTLLGSVHLPVQRLESALPHAVLLFTFPVQLLWETNKLANALRQFETFQTYELV